MNYIIGKFSSIFSLVLAVVGIGLAIYFYNASKKERIPIFLAEENPKSVVNKKNISAIKGQDILITIRHNKKIRHISDNVFVSTVYFWNSGTLSIKKSHILSKLIIAPKSKNIKIISYSLLSAARPNINKFKLKYEPKEKGISMSFDILEKDDGASIQILYEGDSDAKFILLGALEGVRHFKTTIQASRVTKAIYIIFSLLLLFVLFLAVTFLTYAVAFPLFKYLLSNLNKFLHFEFLSYAKDYPRDAFGIFVIIPAASLLLVFVVLSAADNYNHASTSIPKKLIKSVNGR